MPNSARKRPQTENDLRTIWNYIAADNLRAAETTLDTIEKTFDVLADSPLIGRLRIDLVKGLRSFPVGNYVIFYVALSDGVDVVRVMHGRQDVTAEDMM